MENVVIDAGPQSYLSPLYTVGAEAVGIATDVTDINDHSRPAPLALIHEPAGASLEAGLRQLGWRVQPMSRGDLNVVAGADADLWVIALGSAGADPCPFLRVLSRLRAAVPLLLVVDTHHIRTQGHELARLMHNWPSSAEVLVWPYSREELQFQLLRLRLVRTQESDGDRVYQLGELQVDMGRHEVVYAGSGIPLTLTEFRILHALVDANGRTVPKSALLECLPGDRSHYGAGSIEVYVSRLRGRLEAAGAPSGIIRTVRGIGYRLDPARLERL